MAECRLVFSSTISTSHLSFFRSLISGGCLFVWLAACLSVCLCLHVCVCVFAFDSPLARWQQRDCVHPPARTFSWLQRGLHTHLFLWRRLNHQWLSNSCIILAFSHLERPLPLPTILRRRFLFELPSPESKRS